MIKVNPEVKECDVLVVGGGIGGLMAAIAAADGGAKVIVCDKSDTRRSGSGATGNDHFNCYIPEVQGGTLEESAQELDRSMVGGWADPSLQRLFMARSYEVVQDWDKWGINMKPRNDRYEFNGHAFPGRMRVFLKYDGWNQKAVLTEQALKRGVVIDNKTPITEYLVDDDGKVIGAMGISIAKLEPEVKLYKAKAIISTTGNTSRLYPSITGGMMFNTAHCPANAGGGRAAAYRIGAELVNLEIPNTHAGPKYMERCGKATWIGVLSDRAGKPVGPFVSKPTKELGDVTADVWHSVFRDKYEDGSGPVFMNCTETAPEDMEYMLWGLKCEGDTSILDAMEKQQVDLGKDMVEFTQYEPIMIGRGIQIDEHAATNVPGLYAAGDEVGNFRADIAGAAIYGRIAGENAATYIKSVETTEKDLLKHPVVAANIERYGEMMEETCGPSWKELNMGVQQIMNDYAGISHPRSESMLMAGLENLERLERNAAHQIRCKDSHELMRAIESYDLLEIGKLVCITAMKRKETRAMHKRSDCTFTNPLLDDMFLTVKQVSGKPEMSWRKKY